MEEQVAILQKEDIFRAFVARRPLTAFFALAFAISWITWPLSWFVKTGSLNGFEIIASVGPALAAMVISGIQKPQASGTPVGKRWVLFFLALAYVMAILAFYRFWTTTGLVNNPAIPISNTIYPSLVAVLMDILAASAAALVFSGVYSSKEGVRNLLCSLNLRQSKVSWHWFAIAIGIYPATVLIGNAISSLAGMGAAVGGVTGSWYWVALDVALMFFSPFLMGGLEEPGWRGFALPSLQKRFSPFRSTMILGLIWAVWHLPMLWGAGFPGGVFGTFFWTLRTIQVGILATMLYNRTGGSLPVVIFWHVTFNITSIYMPIAPLTGMLWLLLGIALAIWMWRKPETFRLSEVP